MPTSPRNSPSPRNVDTLPTFNSSQLAPWKMMVRRRLSFLGWYIFRGELLNFQGVWWWLMIYNGYKQVNTTNCSKHPLIHCHVKRHQVVFHEVSRCYNPWVSCFKGCFHVSEIASYPRWRVFSHPISWNICMQVKIPEKNVNHPPFLKICGTENYFVVSTPLKNISQNGNLPQVGVQIENV